MENSWHRIWRLKEKVMDELLKEITNLKPVKSDSRSLSRHAATVLSFINNMEQNGCEVTNAAEAPFVMSELLSNLDATDNVEYGREMYRLGKEETVLNLIDWLNKEASLKSCVKRDASHNNAGNHCFLNSQRSLNYVMNCQTRNDKEEACPTGCDTNHHLSACPVFHGMTVDERWEIVKQNNQCCKCLKRHHTNDCKKPDGTMCNKCPRRHHKFLHNDRLTSVNSNLNPEVALFTNASQEIENHSKEGSRNFPFFVQYRKST